MVVFHRLRINVWKVHAWWPVFVKDANNAQAFAEHRKGLLGYQQAFFPSPVLVQYWRSFEHLERLRGTVVTPPRAVAAVRPARRLPGDVGIWYETYRVLTANIETIYGNMPP